ncbi:uncharacterized protein LOC144791977 isoform X2 [Lissotriton helveticus]
MKGYGMSRTKGKEPLQQWSCMYHQSGVISTQVSRNHLSFSYPVPPYMYLRMIVRKEIVFTPRARTLLDMLKRFELRDFLAKHTWYVSSSRPAPRNPDAHSPGWDQKVMVSSEKQMPSWHAKMRSKKPHVNGEEESVGNIEDKDKKSSNRDTVTFQHYANYKTKVSDTDGKQLRKGGSTIIAMPSNSNRDTLDIHIYAADGGDRMVGGTLESSTILENFLEDDMFRSVLEDILGGSEALYELEKRVHGPESLSGIEEFPEAPAPHLLMARLEEDATSSPTALESADARVTKAIRVLGRDRIGVALNLSGTNSYLACGTGTPPSLTMER